MAGLALLLAVLAILILLVRLAVRAIRRKPITRTVVALLIVVAAYSALWCVFYFISGDKAVPLGTDVCFDDWCATVTSIERPAALGTQGHELYPHGQFVILHVKMSNRARGIAQKPSEPRIHIIDDKGNAWPYSEEAQRALENAIGKQAPLDSRLELHQSLETQIVFDVPKDAQHLKALIEEGPWISKVELYKDRMVFDCP